MSESKVPKAFISYSHDSLDHKKWVLDLATRLRNNGVDAILDQWSLGPGDDLPSFMERNLAEADRVLMVCTDNYVKKANSGAGGVGYEKMIVTADLLRAIDSNKVIPLIRQLGTQEVPTFLRSKLFLDFSTADGFEFAFDGLIRALHNAPLFIAPPVSNNPFAPVEKTPVERAGDGVKLIMTAMVDQFEKQTSDWMRYDDVFHQSGMSRIVFDMFTKQAISEGLVVRPRNPTGGKYFELTDAGRKYALHHGLVDQSPA